MDQIILSLGIRTLIFVIFIIGLNNYTLSKTFIWSVGHMAFFGIGAFATAILIVDFNLPFYIALLVGMLLGGFGGLVSGWVGIRLKGDYFIIFSLAMVMTVRSISIYWKGPKGINNIPRPEIFGLSLESDLYFLCLLVLPVLALLLYLTRRLERSPLIRISKVVRENEILSRVLNIDSRHYRLGFFILGSSIAALAGGLYTLFTKATDPNIISLYYSVFIFSVVLIYGFEDLRKSFLAAFTLVFIPWILNDVLRVVFSVDLNSEQYVWLIFGLLLIFSVRQRAKTERKQNWT